MCKTTASRWICVLWKNSENSWERFADLKESNPLVVVEYALAQRIDHKAALCWWVPRVIKRREQIMSNHYLKQTHKIGIAVLKTVQDGCTIGSGEWQYSGWTQLHWRLHQWELHSSSCLMARMHQSDTSLLSAT
jgi:hypothetical protein